MIRRIVDINSKIINKIKNSNTRVCIRKNINFNNIIYINKFRFTRNDSSPKIIKIIKDENNNNKIIYKNFDESEIEKKYSKADFRDKESSDKNDKNDFKLKIFGSAAIELNESLKSNSNKSQTEKNNFNVFENIENESNEQTRNKTLSEDVSENLLNYASFFSDYCRVYVKAGEGGNGSISVLKGPMFDQGKISIYYVFIPQTTKYK